MLIAIIVIVIGFLIIFLAISQTIYSKINIKRIKREALNNPNKVYIIGAGNNTIEIESPNLIYIFGKDKKTVPIKAIDTFFIVPPTSIKRGKLMISASDLGGKLNIEIVFCDVDQEKANKIVDVITNAKTKAQEKYKKKSEAKYETKVEEEAVYGTKSQYYQTSTVDKNYFRRKYRVIGVTFKNGSKSRQSILRAIRFGDPPFEISPIIALKEETYEGEPSISVWADDQQVGYISKDDLEYLLSNWDNCIEVEHFEIIGGGVTDTGEKLSYGMEIALLFNKSKKQTSV